MNIFQMERWAWEGHGGKLNFKEGRGGDGSTFPGQRVPKIPTAN